MGRNVALGPAFQEEYLDSISPYWGTRRISLKVKAMGMVPFSNALLYILGLSLRPAILFFTSSDLELPKRLNYEG